MPQPKLIIFDLDGTLIDTADAYLDFLNYLLKKWNKPTVTKEFFLKTLFWKNISIEIAETAGQDKVEEGMQIYKKDFKSYFDKINLMKNAEKKVKKLSTLFKLAIFTNSLHSAAEGILKHFELLQYFSAIVGFDDVEERKPDPEGLLKIMKRFFAAPEETVYVGDSLSDMKTAEAAGCLFIGYGMKEKFPNHRSITDLYELCDIFK